MNIKNIIVALACILLTACATTTDTTFEKTITTDPSGAQITVNGNAQGESPVQLKLDRSTLSDISILASKEGYFSEATQVSAQSLASSNPISLTLQKSPIWHATVENPVLNQWLILAVDETQDPDQVWNDMVSAMSERFGSILNMNFQLGSAQTDYIKQRFQTPRGALFLRSRMEVNRSSRTPLVYKLKLVSEWSQGASWQPYNRAFLQDDNLMKQLFGRFSG